ncbi:condensin complex subunit 3 [Dorcoceras hygrometricum]|uniref:Condensin complex subunit 3 n=1 Tax=Dorcoceras hygrometricum TaxID=472368 RepID=A0A2Z7BUS0_9LAMI|nr:condensin complex subunit 3 [Dorcoceras hygrometricum]
MKPARKRAEQGNQFRSGLNKKPAWKRSEQGNHLGSDLNKGISLEEIRIDSLSLSGQNRVITRPSLPICSKPHP